MSLSKRRLALLSLSLCLVSGCFVLFSLDDYGPPGLAPNDAASGDSPNDATVIDARADVRGNLDGKVVFVTSDVFAGSFGGISSADARCQALAVQAGLTGTFKAWVSTDASSPSRSFAALIATDGGSPPLPPQPSLITADHRAIIASGYEELADAGPRVPILMMENGSSLPPTPETIDAVCPDAGSFVWTNTTPRGGTELSADCFAWTSADASAYARAGRLTLLEAGTLQDWTAECFLPCSVRAHFYCFEQ